MGFKRRLIQVWSPIIKIWKFYNNEKRPIGLFYTILFVCLVCAFWFLHLIILQTTGYYLGTVSKILKVMGFGSTLITFYPITLSLICFPFCLFLTIIVFVKNYIFKLD